MAPRGGTEQIQVHLKSRSQQTCFSHLLSHKSFETSLLKLSNIVLCWNSKLEILCSNMSHLSACSKFFSTVHSSLFRLPFVPFHFFLSRVSNLGVGILVSITTVVIIVVVTVIDVNAPSGNRWTEWPNSPPINIVAVKAPPGTNVVSTNITVTSTNVSLCLLADHVAVSILSPCKPFRFPWWNCLY